MSRVIIALDLGTHCGLAFQIVGKGVNYAPLDLSVKGKFGEDGFYVFHEWLDDVIKTLSRQHKKISLVVEKPHAGRFFHSVRILFGLLGVVFAVASKNSLVPTLISPMTVKKAWTGNGHAKKHEMIAEGKRRGFNIDDDNVMDAVALLHTYRKMKK